jgi:hypothetical protein
MANISHDNFMVGIEEFVVFKIGGDKNIGLSGNGLWKQETAGPTTHGHPLYFSIR